MNGERETHHLVPEEGETYRAAIEAKRPPEIGGGACALVVRRVDGRIQLLFHATLSTGAELTDELADELARHLIGATRRE